MLDLLELGRSLAALVAAARPLDGSKLQPPHADPRPGIDVGELADRAVRVRELALAAVTALDRALEGDGSEAVHAALAAAWGFGVGGASVPATTDVASLRASADRARAALQARLDEDAAIAPAGDGDELATAQRRLGALLGPGFVALPRFIAPDAEDLVASRDDPALAGDDPLVAETWLMRLERVREPLMRLGIALREAEALGGMPMRLGLAQTPHHPGAAWNGRPAPAYVDGATSLVLVGAEVLAPGRPLAGLLVDELTELVPSATETTGVAFRYEPPTAMAPQALLLAVPPVTGEEWTGGGLNQVLLETIDLAHVRALAPNHLDLVRQFLPATVLPFNTDGDVPSTNPNSLQPEELRWRRSPPSPGSSRNRAVATSRSGRRHPCAIRCGCWRASGRSVSSPATTPAVRSSPGGAASPRAADALRRRNDPAGHHARRAAIRPDGGTAGVDHRARHRATAGRRRHVRRDPPRRRHRPALPRPAGPAGHVARLSRRFPRPLPARDAERRAARRARPGDRRLRPPARRS